jgi:hypothetical protein
LARKNHGKSSFFMRAILKKLRRIQIILARGLGCPEFFAKYPQVWLIVDGDIL